MLFIALLILLTLLALLADRGGMPGRHAVIANIFCPRRDGLGAANRL